MAERGETAEPGESAPPRGAAVVLLVAMAVASVCGLVYELLAGALSSYLLGSSVTEFSLVVGIFLSAMGVGSWLSQHVRGSLVAAFVAVELLVGVVGGVIGVAGFAAFALTSAYRVVLLGLVIATGVLIGLEVPLVVRILQHRTQLRVSVANVLSADYLGALFGSLLFPFVLVPEAGLIRAGLLAGLANVGVGWITLWLLREAIGRSLRPLVAGATAATALLGGLLVFAQPLSAALEQELYQDDVILTRDSQYQKITITRWRDDIRLYLDGNLQFSSVDEYRYHESLVHPALSLVPHARRVLVLGGGDGLAAREILKWGPDEVVIVDLDPEITRLFRDRPILAAINGRSLHDPRVRVVNTDAMGFLADGTDAWDVIIADLPDPNTLAVGKLYSRQFYRLALKRLSRQGVFVTQATSPFETRAAFWCIVHTLRAVEPRGGGTLHVAPYTTHVPSFGEWGFVLASERAIEPAAMHMGVETRYVTPEVVQRMFVFGKDTAEVDSPVNDLDDQPLVRLYEEGYKRFYD
ncbi:MAG: polyamine aminopropyltransferase 1 [Myxococcales bacterium]